MLKLFIPYLEPWQDDSKSSAWRAVLVFVGYFIFMIFANIVMQVLVEIFHISPSTSLYSYLLLGVEIIIFIFTLWLLKKNAFKFFSKGAITKQGLIQTGLVYVTMFLTMSAFGMAVEHFFPTYVAPDNQIAIEGMVASLSPLTMFFMIVISAPILEELLIRGLFMKYIFKNKPVLGALVAALVFAFLHTPSNWIDFTLYFILSCGLTFIYWQTRRIEYPIIIHLLNNLVSFTILLLQ